MFWRDGQTLGWLPLVECHWDWLCFNKEAFSEDSMSLQGVREVLGLCAAPGSSWEAVVTLSKPTPCTDQSTSPTWCHKEGGSWPATPRKPWKWCMDGPCTGAGCFCPVCGRVCICCKVGTRSKFLLKLMCVKIQISGVVCGWSAMKGRRSVTVLGPSQIWVKQGKYKSKDIAGWISLVLY